MITSQLQSQGVDTVVGRLSHMIVHFVTKAQNWYGDTLPIPFHLRMGIITMVKLILN